MSLFFATFFSLFQSVLVIFIIALIAGILVHKGVLNDHVVRSLSQVTVQILLPSLIFSSIAGHLDVKDLPVWWIIPLISSGTTAIGFGLGFLFFMRDLPSKRNLIPLSAMMNAGYFILPIGQVVFTGQFERFALFVSLYILGVSPLIWSVGKYFMTGNPRETGNWKQMITPPLIANLLGIFMVLTNLNRMIPTAVMDAVDMLGKATVAIATLILGATFGKLSFHLHIPPWDVIRVILIKLFLVPAIMVTLLLIFPLYRNYPLLNDLLILEASAPAATALIIQIRRYGGDEHTVGGVLLISYLVCLLTVPFWLAIWRTIL